MKKFSMLPFTVVFAAFITFGLSWAGPEPPKDYFWVSDVQGKVIFDAGKGPKAVQIMERIVLGTVLTIGENASIAISRAGYKTLNLTSLDSPYTVDKNKFESDSGLKSKIIRHLENAYNYFIHPETKPSTVVRLVTRGRAGSENQCQESLWPLHKSDILYRKDEPITLRWDLEGGDFSLVVLDHSKGSTVFRKVVSGNSIDIPMTALKPGGKYTWEIAQRGTENKCSAVFGIVGEEESAEILENLSALTTHLPVEASSETRYRMQAGYLASELLVYDAWKLLERHGIKP